MNVTGVWFGGCRNRCPSWWRRMGRRIIGREQSIWTNEEKTENINQEEEEEGKKKQNKLEQNEEEEEGLSRLVWVGAAHANQGMLPVTISDCSKSNNDQCATCWAAKEACSSRRSCSLGPTGQAVLTRVSRVQENTCVYKMIYTSKHTSISLFSIYMYIHVYVKRAVWSRERTCASLEKISAQKVWAQERRAFPAPFLFLRNERLDPMRVAIVMTPNRLAAQEPICSRKLAKQVEHVHSTSTWCIVLQIWVDTIGSQFGVQKAESR